MQDEDKKLRQAVYNLVVLITFLVMLLTLSVLGKITIAVFQGLMNLL